MQAFDGCEITPFGNLTMEKYRNHQNARLGDDSKSIHLSHKHSPHHIINIFYNDEQY